MMRFCKKIITHPVIRPTCIRFFSWLDTFCYKILTVLAIADNDGIHPKHAILRYHDFFASHISSTDRVLDIGCGKGENAFDMAQKAMHVTGIDIKHTNIEKASTQYQRDNLLFLVGDALTYHFDQTFDIIALSNVLEHIEERVDFLQRLKRLAPTILLRVPMINRDWLTVYKQQKGFEYRLDPTHYIEYTMETLQKELDTSGWTIETHSIQFGEVWAVLNREA